MRSRNYFFYSKYQILFVMLEAKFIEGSLFKKIFEAVKDILNESRMEFDENGLYLHAMDSSHVTLVSLSLQRELFEKYSCSRNISLGVNLTSMMKILKCSSSDESVSITTDGTDTIVFVFNGSNMQSEYEMKLIDLECDRIEIPDPSYKYFISLHSSELSKICRDLSSFGDTMTISCNKESVSFSITGDVGKGNIVIKNSGGVSITHNGTEDKGEPIVLSFSLRYFNLFMKAAPLSSNVTIYLGNEDPLSISFFYLFFLIYFPSSFLNQQVLEYRIGSGGYLKYYLAPKIQDV